MKMMASVSPYSFACHGMPVLSVVGPLRQRRSHEQQRHIGENRFSPVFYDHRSGASALQRVRGRRKVVAEHHPWDTHPYSALLTEFVDNFFKCSVPILSVISGYLFFNGSSPDMEYYLRKYRNSRRTVLLPMVSWGLICMGILLSISWISPHSRLLALSPYDVSKIGLLDLENVILAVRVCQSSCSSGFFMICC